MALAALPAQRAYGHPPDACRSADEQQAAYFLELLGQSRQELDRRINKYLSDIANAAERHDSARADRVRRLLRGDEHEREVVDGLVDGLRERFVRREPGEVFPIVRRARSAAR